MERFSYCVVLPGEQYSDLNDRVSQTSQQIMALISGENLLNITIAPGYKGLALAMVN
ncbi:hypothetical protein D3C77_245100 [compost metagenome]